LRLNQFFRGASASHPSVRGALDSILHTIGTLTLVTGFWFWRPRCWGRLAALFAGVFGSS
jgi:hypothetical protein